MLYPCKFGSTGTGNVVDLGTGTTFDVSKYAGHGSFTLDNFIVSVESFYGLAVAGSNNGSGEVRAQATPTINKSYNPSTGVLTVSANNTSATKTVNNVTSSVYIGSLTYHAYLVRG